MIKHHGPYLRLSALLLFWLQVSAASTPDSTVLMLGQTITAGELKQHLEIIASDVMEGRDTGESGQKMAAAYIRYHFKLNGLKASVSQRGQMRYYQTFYLKRVTPGPAWIEVNGNRVSGGRELLYTGRDRGSIRSAELIFIGHGTDAVLKEVDVTGKVAVALSTDLYKLKDLKKNLAAEGARGLVVVYGAEQEDFDGMAQTYARWYGRSEVRPAGTPADSTAGVFLLTPQRTALLFDKEIKALRDIATKMEDGNFKTFSNLPKKTVRYYNSLNEKILETENVLGLIEGREKPEELVVISAHYDHVGAEDGKIFNGADDDGSGTVAVLEIAEAFAEARDRGAAPYRSVLFIAFTGEERGLLGSENYVENPVVPLRQTVANLNIDMAGRIDPKHEENPEYIYVIGSDRLSTELHEINERMNASYTGLTLDYTYNKDGDPNRYYYRSDHYNFVKHNIPSIFYFNGTHADYHKPTDTVEKIRFDLLEERARLVFHTAWHLANSPERITADKVVK